MYKNIQIGVCITFLYINARWLLPKETENSNYRSTEVDERKNRKRTSFFSDNHFKKL